MGGLPREGVFFIVYTDVCREVYFLAKVVSYDVVQVGMKMMF